MRALFIPVVFSDQNFVEVDCFRLSYFYVMLVSLNLYKINLTQCSATSMPRKTANTLFEIEKNFLCEQTAKVSNAFIFLKPYLSNKIAKNFNVNFCEQNENLFFVHQ